MANTVNTFTLKLDNQNFQKQLDEASKYSKKYNDQIANSILRGAELENKRSNLLKERAVLEAKGTKQSKEKIAVINKEIRATGSLITAENKRVAGLKKANEYLNITTANIKKKTSVIKANTAAQNRNNKATGSATNTLIRHLRQIETAVIAYYALSRGFQATIGVGLEVNKMMEDNRSGIAALLSANTQMVLSNGEVVNSYEKFKIGQKVAAKTMEDLRKASVKTYATFPQLTEIFQQAIGQTLSMGDAFGGTTQEIIDNTVQLTQSLSNIAGAIGMPMDRVREEIRSMLSGNASTDSLISTMLFGSPGEANKAIRDAKARGIVPFDVLADVDSYTRSLLMLQDAWSQTMAQMSAPVFEDLKITFKEMAQYINENQEAIQEGFESFYENGKKVVGILDDIAIAVIAFYGAKGIIAAYDLLDSKTIRVLTNQKLLLRTTKALALANPFTAWVVGITSVIAGMYELQRISEQMSKERFEENVTRIIAPTAGITTATPKAQAEAAEASTKARMDVFTKLALKQEKTRDGINQRTLRSIEIIGDEYLRLGRIADGTTQKVKDLKEMAELVTKLSLDSDIAKQALKYTETELTKLGKLKQALKEYEAEIKRINKEVEDKIPGEGPTEKQQAAIDTALKIQTDAQKKAKKEIAAIELDAQQKLLKAEQDLWVAKRKAEGVEVSIQQIATWRLSALGRQVLAEDDVVDKLILQKQIHEQIYKINKANETDFTKWVKERTKYWNDLLKAEEKEAEDEAVKIGDILASQMASSLTNAIQEAIDNEFNFQDFTASFASAVGNAMVQASLASMIQSSAMMAGPAGLALGVGVMAVSSYLGRDGGGVITDTAGDEFDEFISGLKEASEALRNFDNVGTEISSEIFSHQTEIAKYNKTMKELEETGKLKKDQILDPEDPFSAFYISPEDVAYGIAELERQPYTDALNKLLKENVSQMFDFESMDSAQLKEVTGITDIAQFNQDLALIDSQLNDFAIGIKQMQIEGATEEEINDYMNAVTDAGKAVADGASVAELYSSEVKITSENWSEAIDVMNESVGTVEETIMSLAEASDLIASDIVKQWSEADARLQSLSDTFRNLGESIEDTISTLLGGSDALDAQDRLIEDFWAKQSELDVLLATEGQLSTTQEARLADLIGDVNQLATEIQKSSIGENTQITNELVTELGTLGQEIAERETGLSVQETIRDLTQTAIDYLGPDSDIAKWLETLAGTDYATNSTINEQDYATYIGDEAVAEAYAIKEAEAEAARIAEEARIAEAEAEAARIASFEPASLGDVTEGIRDAVASFTPTSDVGAVLSDVSTTVSSFFGGLFNGSHANGLDYVPFDGYRAELHQGERVLTRAENNMYPSRNMIQSYANQTSDPEIKELLTKIDEKLGKINETNQKTSEILDESQYEQRTLSVKVIGTVATEAAS